MIKRKARKIVGTLVDRWISRLHLGNYTIEWTWMQGDANGYIWRCTPRSDKRRARIAIDATEPWDEIRQTVIHELLHVLHSPLYHTLEDLEGSDYVPRAAYRMLDAAYTREEECQVEYMTLILCDLEPWLTEDADLAEKWEKVR